MWTINYIQTNLVSRYRGCLPVLLTCPHDGEQTPPNVAERNGRPSITKNRDVNAAKVTREVAQKILEITGEPPYIVAANFHRKYIDANRAAPTSIPPSNDEKCAYDEADAAKFYNEYHQRIRDYIEEIRQESGGYGLLFDFHGVAQLEQDPSDIYLGTVDGTTIAALRNIDSNVMFRRRSLRTYLDLAGFVLSPKQPGDAELSEVNGGFTIRQYGSHHSGGIDAIQIEMIAEIRNNPSRRASFVEALSWAIVNLVSLWADYKIRSNNH
jgi:N-formylglutamate amidohydrolase